MATDVEIGDLWLEKTSTIQTIGLSIVIDVRGYTTDLAHIIRFAERSQKCEHCSARMDHRDILIWRDHVLADSDR